MDPTPTQQQLQQQNVVIHVEEPHNNIPVQMNQHAAPQIHVAGEEMAHFINRQLPGPGHVQPPIAPSANPDETIQKPKNKKERNLLKCRQQEAQRAKEEEEQRLKLLNKENKRQYKIDRQKCREFILSDEKIIELLSAFSQEKDTEKAIEKAQTFLIAATKKLFTIKGMKEDHSGTTDYAKEMIPPLRLLIGTQIENSDTVGDLLEKTKDLQTVLEEITEARAIANALDHLMGDVLEEELEANDLMQKALGRIMDDLPQQVGKKLDQYTEFAHNVGKRLHMKPEKEGDWINVFGSKTPFAYLKKKDTIKEFDTKIEQLMNQDKSLSREAAEQMVFAQYRKELQENAERQTLNGSVISNVSAEDWKKHGGASYHHVLPAPQAYAVVEKSDGFLYAKPAGNGLCELRPTLPETVQINGETIPLRRTYNLFVKAIMRRVLDENGDLCKDAMNFVKEECHKFCSVTLLSDPQKAAETLSTALHSQLRATMVEMLRGNETRADQTLDHVFKLIMGSSNYSFMPDEIINDLTSIVYRIKSAGPNSSAGQRFEKVRQKMVKEGSSPDEIEAVMNKLVNPDLVERAYKMREEFKKQNGGAPLTREQERQISAVYSMYADMDMAVKEMMAIRNMKPDSPDVPFPNACSANSSFITGIKKDFFNIESDSLAFRIDKHIYAHPIQHINFLLDHINEIFIGERAKKKYGSELRNIAERINNGEDLRSPEGRADFLTLKDLTKNNSPFTKYNYHMAANLGKMDDNTIITSEAFAAETKQFMVSPFSINLAVGIYHGEQSYEVTKSDRDFVSKGMIDYYLLDNPLPDEEELVLINTKNKM